MSGGSWQCALSCGCVICAFYNRYNCFTGMILDFCNGARCAFGECRLGFDKIVTTENPQRFCFARMKTGESKTEQITCSRYAVEITPDEESRHTASEDRWTCCWMTGHLECGVSILEMTLVEKAKSQEELQQMSREKVALEIQHTEKGHPSRN